jgi:hypothetical protein
VRNRSFHGPSKQVPRASSSGAHCSQASGVALEADVLFPDKMVHPPRVERPGHRWGCIIVGSSVVSGIVTLSSSGPHYLRRGAFALIMLAAGHKYVVARWRMLPSGSHDKQRRQVDDGVDESGHR